MQVSSNLSSGQLDQKCACGALRQVRLTEEEVNLHNSFK